MKGFEMKTEFTCPECGDVHTLDVDENTKTWAESDAIGGLLCKRCASIKASFAWMDGERPYNDF